MLKLPCNVADRVQILAQCGLMGRPNSVPTGRRRSAVTGFQYPATKGWSVMAVVSDKEGAVVNRVEPDLGRLADRLRLGSLSEDGLSYKEKFIVRSYEVGINKTATVETIANLLQVFLHLHFFIDFDSEILVSDLIVWSNYL